jgi:hypothetical protein
MPNQPSDAVQRAAHVDAAAILLGAPSPAAIAAVIRDGASVPSTSVREQANGDMTAIAFHQPSNGLQRFLHVFPVDAASGHVDELKEPATLVTIGAFGDYERTIGALLDRFGGYYRLRDSDPFVFSAARSQTAEPPSDQWRFAAASRRAARAVIEAFAAQGYQAPDAIAFTAALGRTLREFFPAAPATEEPAAPTDPTEP